MRAVEALQEFGEARQIPAKILFGLTLALEECGSNIVSGVQPVDVVAAAHLQIARSGWAVPAEYLATSVVATAAALAIGPLPR